MRRRYFGISDFSFHGGVFAPDVPAHRFQIELIDSHGKAIVSTWADQQSLKAEIPDGHGFSMPIPTTWLLPNVPERYFQFRIVETGDIFPKEARELPVEKLLKQFDAAAESGYGLGLKLRKLSSELPQKIGGKTIVVVTHSMTRTGAPMIILEIIKRLTKKHGFEVVLLCLESQGALHHDFESHCIEIVEDFESSLRLAQTDARNFLTTIKQAVSHPLALVNSLCSTNIALACREAGFEVKSLIHEYPYAFDGDWTRSHLAAASGVVFPCRDVYDRFVAEQMIIENAPEVETEYCILPQGCYQLEQEPPNATEAESFSEWFKRENHLRSSDRLVIACGTVDSRKGFDWFANLIRFYATHSQHIFTTHFVWVGPINEESVFFHAIHDMTREGVIGHFHHLDEVEDVRLPMREADLFLLCSRIDPFPSVVLEAFLAGLPVIAFDRDQGSADLIQETGFGKVVPYQDLEATTATIDELLYDSADQENLRESRKSFVAENYSFTDYTDRLAEWMLGKASLPSAIEEFDSEPEELNSLDEDKPKKIEAQSFCPVAHMGHGCPVSPEQAVFSKSDSISQALDRGLDYLASAQHPDGEFTTLLWTGDDPEAGTFDSSPFVTTFAAYSLGFCLPRARPMLNRALSFLVDHMEPDGAWRYYTRKQFKHARVPPDVDDTACASFILKRNGIDVPMNEWMFAENQGLDGLYYTWLLHEQSDSPAYRAYLAALEELAELRTPPKPSEYMGNLRFNVPKDSVPVGEIDAVVNANVVLYLGENEGTKASIDYLIELVESHQENGSTFYYSDIMSFYYMIARASDCSVPRFAGLAPLIADRIKQRLADPIADNNPLNVALAACALLTFAPESEALGEAIELLLENQKADGSWPLELFYDGVEVAWGSSELTTCFALEALSRYSHRENDTDQSAQELGITASRLGDSIEVDLESDEFELNPYPTLAFLRKNYPVVYNESSETWVVTRYDDCVRVLEDFETYSSLNNSFESILMGGDGPAQHRVHHLVKSMFSAENLVKLEDRIRQWITPVFQSFKERRSCEFYSELAAILPNQVITWFLGVPDSSASDFSRWSGVFRRISSNRCAIQINPKESEAIEECRSFFREHIINEQRNSSMSPFSNLVHPADPCDRMDDQDLVDIAVLLMSAGSVTTVNLLATSIYYMASDPSLTELLRENKQLIPGFIEEVLRFETPGQEIFRITKKSSILAGQSIPAGARVQVMPGSANRDETIFPQAGKFIFDRKSNRHIAFGRGSHACVGMAVSRLEAKIVIEMLLEKFDHIELDQENQPNPIKTQFVLRSPERVPLILRTTQIENALTALR